MRALCLLFAFVLCSTSCHAAQRPSQGVDDFFDVTNLWTFELRLAQSAWKSVSSEGQGPVGATRPTDALLAIDGVQYSNVVIRLKGGGTRSGVPQGRPPLRVIFLDTNSFPVRELSLNNNFFDSSFMRDALSYKCFRDFGVPAPKTAYAKLYVAFSDSKTKRYIGLYTVSEVVDEQFIQAHFGDASGLLLKPELGHQGLAAGDSWKEYERFLIPKSRATPAQQDRMLSFIRLINRSDAATFQNQIRSYVHLDNYLRFLVVNVALANLDSYLGMGKNYYMYLHPGTGQLHWIPWDHDLSFGGFFLCGTAEERMTLSIDNPSTVNDTLLKRLLAIPEIKEQYHHLMRDFLAKHFQAQSVFRQIDQLVGIIQPPVLEEKRRSRAGFQRSVDGRKTEPPGAVPTREMESPWQGGLLEPGLKLFVERRAQSIQSQLAGVSRGARPRFGQ
jgi:spore coat protein H